MSEVSDKKSGTQPHGAPTKAWFEKLCFWRTSSADGDENSNVGLVVFLAAVVVIALLGYFTSRAALSVDMVNTRLQIWGDMMKESAARKGYDANFTHGSISIEGGLFSKRAVIADPRITLSRHNKLARSFATSVVEIQPDTAEMEKLRLVFPAPLHIKGEDGEARRFEMVTPLEVEVIKTDNGQAYEGFIPTQISIFKDKDEAGDAIPYMTFETKLGSKVKGFIGVDSEEYTQQISLAESVVKTADRTTKVASLELHAEAAKEDAARMTHYELKVARLDTTGFLSVIAPLDIEADVDRETASVLSEDNNENHKDYSYFFNALSVHSGSSVLKLMGKFDVIKDEILPMGSAEVSLSNVGVLMGRLQSAGVLDDRSTEVTRTILKRISSEWNTKTDTIHFSLDREYGGGFYVGDVTFEELLATALKQYLLGVTQPESKSDANQGDSGDAAVDTHDEMPDVDIISNGGLEHDAAPASASPVSGTIKDDKKLLDGDVKFPEDMDKHKVKPDAALEKPISSDKSDSLLDKLFSSDHEKSSMEDHQFEGNGDSPSAMESLEDMESEHNNTARPVSPQEHP